MKSESMRATLRITKALADLQRLRIIMMLESGELCVCQIVAVLGLAPSTVSKHLSILADAGLVDCRKDGRWSYYSVPNKTSGVSVKQVLRWLSEALEKDHIAMDDKKKLTTVVATELDSLCRQQRTRND